MTLRDRAGSLAIAALHTGQAAPPAAEHVFVTNTGAAQAVPTAAQGTTHVSGSVSITGTPTVNLASGTTVRISGTPTVNLGAGNSVGLAYPMRGRTTFVIAHRLSTIRRADQILVVENGNILECSTHEPLYLAGGRYYELYTTQHGLETNLFLAPGEGVIIEAPVGTAPDTNGGDAAEREVAGAEPDALRLLRNRSQ